MCSMRIVICRVELMAFQPIGTQSATKVNEKNEKQIVRSTETHFIWLMKIIFANT